MISIVVPTIRGREHHLSRFMVSYGAHTEDYELIVVPNDGKPVGVGWQMGADKARGDYLHLTNDDIQAHAGWWKAAVDCVDSGLLPCPRVLSSDGTLQSCGDWGKEVHDGTVTAFTRVPFLSREQWQQIGPLIPTHYYSDNWISYRGRQVGIDTVVCRDYLLTHHFASEGRVDSRVGEDCELYNKYVAGELAVG